MVVLKVECAWCKSLIGGDPQAKVVSHGICLDCMERELAIIIDDPGKYDPSVWEAWLDTGGEG